MSASQSDSQLRMRDDALAGTLELVFDFPAVEVDDMFELIRLNPGGTFGDTFIDTINVSGLPSGLTANVQILGDSVQATVAQIPEPSTAMLLQSRSLGLLGGRWCRRLYNDR